MKYITHIIAVLCFALLGISFVGCTSQQLAKTNDAVNTVAKATTQATADPLVQGAATTIPYGQLILTALSAIASTIVYVEGRVSQVKASVAAANPTPTPTTPPKTS